MAAGNPLCYGYVDLFFGPDTDGVEEEQVARERDCVAICTACALQLSCLRQALVEGEEYGVWGGLGERERRDFRRHLLREGYKPDEVLDDEELGAALRSFRRGRPRWTA